MQYLTLTVITASEKYTIMPDWTWIMLDSTLNHDKVTQARNVGQGHRFIVCA